MDETKNNDSLNKMAAFWTILALVAASIEPIIVKMGYRGNVTPYQFLIIKSIVAAVLILPITRNFKWIGLHGIKRVAGVSILLLLNNLSTLIALQYVSVVVYLTLITTVPSIIAVVNMLSGKEKIGFKFWAGFLMCFAGVILTLDVKGAGWGQISLIGIVFVLISMACSVIYRIRMESVTEEFKPIIVSLYIFWINAVFILPLIPFAGDIPAQGWKIGVWIGFAAAVANVAFLAALHILGSTRVSIFNILQRPLVMIAAALILNEPMTVLQIIGIVIVMVGVNYAKVEKK